MKPFTMSKGEGLKKEIIEIVKIESLVFSDRTWETYVYYKDLQDKFLKREDFEWFELNEWRVEE